ncbi:hypothetical protein KI387_037929 [Taxus chinensis]|uniref:PPM-type phosphatase domain-containing protein n=1 Tax=Taxus chinensis TaxID=29808 RepID=A0AA38FW83_TAXCH|nr:hypothetical protein KI387_037929 [Taxus chinensis]
MGSWVGFLAGCAPMVSSSVACMFTQQGRKGTNQDAMIVWEAGGIVCEHPVDFGSNKDTVFCGVFDGHGPFGHLAAKRVRDSLPSKLCSQWKAAMERGKESNNTNINGSVGSMNSDETSSLNPWMKNGKNMRTWKILRRLTWDVFCQIIQGEELVFANVGDSRAVLGTRDDDDTLMAVQLTVDLKPNLPKESERIKQFKGRVFALQDEPDVPRVWLPHDDSPGLAMARAFGDFCLKEYGVIAVPEISYHRVTKRDEFIVMATDGVWDVLSNQDVVDIVSLAPTRTTAARSVVDIAVRAWRVKYPTSKIDDCAVVCLYLHNSSLVSEVKTKKDASQELPSTKDATAMPGTVSEDKCP